jgi:hypothetical protein
VNSIPPKSFETLSQTTKKKKRQSQRKQFIKKRILGMEILKIV